MEENKYLYKSKEYQKAVEYLNKVDEKTNNVEVHNMYYAVLLYMKHLVSLFFSHPDVMDTFLLEHYETYQLPTHVGLFSVFHKFVRYYKVIPYKQRTFIYNRMNIMKEERVKAAYTQDLIDDKVLEDAKVLSMNVLNHLLETEYLIQQKISQHKLKRIYDVDYITKETWSFVDKAEKFITIKQYPNKKHSKK